MTGVKESGGAVVHIMHHMTVDVTSHTITFFEPVPIWIFFKNSYQTSLAGGYGYS